MAGAGILIYLFFFDLAQPLASAGFTDPPQLPAAVLVLDAPERRRVIDRQHPEGFRRGARLAAFRAEERRAAVL